MVIREGDCSIEIVSTERVPDHLPSAGDVRLAVVVSSQGFVGDGWAWIEAPRLRQFVEHLRELEARRNGSAEVESISPGQFRLRVLASDRSGRMAVAGRLARGGHALEFGFDFCPSLLRGIVAGFDAIADGRAELGVVPDCGSIT